ARAGREGLLRRRLPRPTAVGGLPDAAPRRPHVVDARLVEHAGDGRHTPTPEWTDQPRGERAEQAGVVPGGRLGRERHGEDQGEERKTRESGHGPRARYGSAARVRVAGKLPLLNAPATRRAGGRRCPSDAA